LCNQRTSLAGVIICEVGQRCSLLAQTGAVEVRGSWQSIRCFLWKRYGDRSPESPVVAGEKPQRFEKINALVFCRLCASASLRAIQLIFRLILNPFLEHFSLESQFRILPDHGAVLIWAINYLAHPCRYGSADLEVSICRAQQRWARPNAVRPCYRPGPARRSSCRPQGRLYTPVQVR
jgi:hypothetical protein